MAEAGVNGIMTADVVTELSNDTILTTSWVNGKICFSALRHNFRAAHLHLPSSRQSFSLAAAVF